jgi:hypothetical protein
MATSRSESMSKIGRLVKERGHALEGMFNSLFNRRQKSLNLTGASSDCFITDNDALKSLKPLNVVGNEVSLKASDTWQFHLGVLPELSDIRYYQNSLRKVIPSGRTKEETHGTHNLSFDEQLHVLRSQEFWWKYLGKGDYLCYTDRMSLWRFFSMKDVINFIIKETHWRLLPTGRIKGDFKVQYVKKNGDTDFKLLKGIITFEYRDDGHNSFVLGAHGAKNGYRLMKILTENIKYVDIHKR